MCDTICHRLLYRRHRGKIHICHPHRDGRKTLLHRYIFIGNLIYCQCVFSFSIHNRCKIKFHPFFLFLLTAMVAAKSTKAAADITAPVRNPGLLYRSSNSCVPSVR